MKRMIALGACLLLAGCSLLPPEAEEPAIEVSAPVVTQREVIMVKRGPVETRLKLNVVLGGERQSPLYFRTGGRLHALHAGLGQKVEAGALLAELEAGSLPYDLESAELDLERAKLKLEQVRSRIGFVNGPSETDLKGYELDVRQAELKLRRIQDQLAATRLYAPFAGEVVQVEAVEGDSVAAYNTVLIIAGDGAVVARAPVDESQAAKLTPGQRVEIFPNDGNPTPIKGRVVSVPAVNTRAEDRVAVFAPDQPSDRLVVGRNGRAEVVLQRKEDVLRVPLSAIRTFSGRSFVTVVNGETRQEVAVEVGLQGDQFAEVLSGLKEGDKVVSR
jgi:RND family efflux transporter MFP subunit